jgi:hypothetical protein
MESLYTSCQITCQCKDLNAIQSSITFRWLLILEEEFKKYPVKNFTKLVNDFGKAGINGW